MIGRQIKGRGFRALLAYLHGKPEAERIAGNLDGVLPREMAREFAEVRRLRPTVSRAVFHMPVRPAPGETLSVDQWREVAVRVAVGMGFGNSPWVAYLHRDAREEHLHLVASRVDYDGRVVSDAHDYRRGMRVLREIERDFDLSLGPPERVDRKPPAQAEKQGVREGISVRARLQEEAARAAEGGPRFGTFLDRLHRADVEIVPSIDSRGEVRGISYRFQGLSFSGSSLGAAYSFPGLQRRLGVRFDPRHDLARLYAHRERALARSASTQEVPLMTESRSTSEVPSPTSSITLGTIRRQLRAIGAERYDVLLVDAASGEREVRARWTLHDIERSLGWLRHRNAQGAEILVRPAGGTPSVLVAEVPKAKLAELSQRELEPAAVIELAHGKAEVWFRHRSALGREEADVVAALLSREIRGGRTPQEPERWGHLAGFTTPLADKERTREGEVPSASFAQLRRGSGTVYERSEEIREEAGALLLERRGERTYDRPSGLSLRQDLEKALERDARDPFAGVGARSEPPTASDLERQHAAWGVARDRFLELRAELPPVRGADLLRREIDVIEAYRHLGDLERGLEEATGLRPFPGHLAAGDLGEAAEISSRWSQAVRDADIAADRALLSPRSELGAIRDEREVILEARAEEAFAFGSDRSVRLDPTPGEALADAALGARPIEPTEIEARAERLREAIEHLGSNPGPVETAALHEAFATKIEGELSVEASRSDLIRATRALTLESDDLSTRLERFERSLGPEHSPAARVEYGEVLARFERVDATLHSLRQRLGEVELASIDRALDRVGLGLKNADEKTVWETSGEPFRRYAERLDERGEIVERLAGRNPDLGREIRPVESTELTGARADLSREAARVVDERTPEALGAYRAAAERLGGIERAGRDRAAEIEFSGARRELRVALRDLRADRSGELPTSAIERFHTALDRFHAAEERFASRLPQTEAQVSSEVRFASLLGRVRQGDHTPETLAQLHRAVVVEIRAATGRVPTTQPDLPPPSRRDLLEGLERYRQARVELSWQVHRHGDTIARREPAALERLHPILSRYQVAARDLERTTERFVRNPQSQVLPVRFFLRHPDYKGAPHRAFAAWARHAAERGRTAPQVRAHLARAVPRSLLSRPSVLSRPWIGRAAFYGVRWAGRTLHRLVREEARSR